MMSKFPWHYTSLSLVKSIKSVNIRSMEMKDIFIP